MSCGPSFFKSMYGPGATGRAHANNYMWVFIAQLVEHCSANAEAMGSNPVEELDVFFGLKFAIA